jgi:hypothetical protein
LRPDVYLPRQGFQFAVNPVLYNETAAGNYSPAVVSFLSAGEHDIFHLDILPNGIQWLCFLNICKTFMGACAELPPNQNQP